MSLPDGPFHYETTALGGEHHGKGHVYIVDAAGRKVATVWGPADTKMALVDLILNARNSLPPTSAKCEPEEKL